MANYYGTTVSRGGKFKKGSENKLQEIVNKYTFGDGQGELSVSVSREGEIQVWGDSSTYAYRKEDTENDEECFDVFLKEITPYLAEPLIVSEVGNEKCRYVMAYAYIAKPSGEVVSVSLDEAIEKELK